MIRTVSRASFVLLSLGLLLPLAAQAKVSAEQAAQLNSTLTPFGAERKGDAAHGIPEWTGGMTQAPAGYGGPGSFHVDPYAGEKPLRVIDAQNMQADAAYLSEGVKALLKTYPQTFKVPVYTSHRSFAAPQDIYQNTFVNAQKAELDGAGYGLVNAYAGIPFPIPADGRQAIWNHIARWQGRYIDEVAVTAQVTPSGSYSILREHIQLLSNYYNPKKDAGSLDNIIYYFGSELLPPSRDVGRALLVQETIDQVAAPRSAWIYNPGQRRVRRAPTLAYDTPIDGIYADDTDMYNGATDRYDWKLVGKQELLVPYHNYAMEKPGLKVDELVKPGHLNSDLTRWEMHRVWVIEATLRAGQRHVHAKRRFYLDEDSWYALMVENYDARGELWHVNLAFTKNAYEVPVITPVNLVFHDLIARSYTAIGLRNNEKAPRQFLLTPPPESNWTPASLRRKGTQ
ncbi:DUF1329 domain-containing protein [Aquipseudomonas ullengensis]|uniref:DUF1329 domain-containing protein n=1 Tax=Aquipseudomonas ullengensis TaxID=2759166 RepID=A0A7W4QCS2_9GAMM|nr:DUF1329 domain-containing protein [Pseudomonas ullengensis]MBB2495286.1 DUF1329 domain-containing protein [Pseudomonas ullengensis]